MFLEHKTYYTKEEREREWGKKSSRYSVNSYMYLVFLQVSLVHVLSTPFYQTQRVGHKWVDDGPSAVHPSTCTVRRPVQCLLTVAVPNGLALCPLSGRGDRRELCKMLIRSMNAYRNEQPSENTSERIEQQIDRKGFAEVAGSLRPC